MKRHDLIVLDLCAIGIIIIAIAVQLSKAFPLSIPVPLPSQLQKSLETDGSFYDNKSVAPNSTPKNTPPPANVSPVSARAYLIGNVESGKIYASQNAKLVLPVASMSKLITAFAATDLYRTDNLVTITEAEMNVASDTSRLVAGEKFTINELLYPMLLNSSNVAAEAIGSSTNRAVFLENMSSYAWEVGMPSTYFADPSGISPQNRSNAADFFALAQYLYKSRPDILKITRTPRAETATTSNHNAHNFVSIHPFVNDPNFLGGKTGHTAEAHDTMLTIMMVGNEPIAIIVLASDNRQKDTAYLLGEITKTLVKQQ